MKHVRSIFMSVLALVTPTSPGIAVADPAVTIVMTGLDNPRGLAFGPDGALGLTLSALRTVTLKLSEPLEAVTLGWR